MILKKPYGMLIKNFRKIHIILTILTIFISIEAHNILSFFNEYVANNYSVTVTDTLLRETINPWIYPALIITIIILIAVFILLKEKKKPTKAYFFTCFYYILLLIFIIVAAVLINTLSKGLWQTASARTYRDFARLIYYPNFLFVLLLLARGLGFNVKQFNFKDDIKELELTDKDSEEVELNLNFQTYKAERTIRRLIRELKYYYLENKRIVYLIVGIIVVVISFFTIKNYEKVRYTYKENTSFSYKGLSLNFIDSMASNIDLKGEVINEDKYYIVARFTVKNSSKNDLTIDYNNFKMYYGNEFVYPKLDMGNSFLDYGKPFMNNVIKAGETKTYIMPYEIDKKYKNKNFKIVIFTGEATKSSDFLAKTITVKLKPNTIEDINEVTKVSLNENMSLSTTALDNSSLTIKSALISNRYEYTYEDCYKETCRTYYDVVVADPSYQTRSALVVMDYDLVLDKEAAPYQNINDTQAFAKNFMELTYTKNNKEYKSKIKYVTPAKVKDKIIFEVDGDVANADTINLLINIRNKSFIVSLK